MNKSAYDANTELFVEQFDKHYNSQKYHHHHSPGVSDSEKGDMHYQLCDIEDYQSEFYFSEYYDILVENQIKTAKSYIFQLSDLYATDTTNIDKKIREMPGEHCFARLDSCSSKPEDPFKTAAEIRAHLENSDRTAHICEWWVKGGVDHHLILREWINEIDDLYELRCYVHDKKLRGISGPYCVDVNETTMSRMFLWKAAIRAFINNILHNTDYDHCVIDLLLPINCFDHAGGHIGLKDKLEVVEINTPVWLFATSGLFDIQNPQDIAILCGDFDSDISSSYPFWKFTDTNSQIISL
jgi:hypothetical protein